MVALLASESVVEAGRRPITRSINQLLLECELPQGSLKGVSHILKVLEKYQIELDPPFEDAGNLDDLRVLKIRHGDETLRQEVRKLLDTRGEDYQVELKSSIRIDTKKMEFNPGLDLKEYVSTKLEAKLAQEICAFLNREGGTIYAGIKNDNSLCGCQHDFDSFKGEGSNQDKADLLIKQIIDRYFLAPNRVLSHIQIDYVDVDASPVVIIRIVKAEKVEFLKSNEHSSSQLYLRIGTSAVPVGFEEIEDYFDLSPTW